MPQFSVIVMRTTTRTKTFQITADTADEARAQALDVAPEDYFDANERDAEYEVQSVLPN